MKTVRLDLYKYSELSDDAKEKAIIKHRDINLTQDWWEFVYKDFVALCGYFGIEVDKDSISFDGFYSQGDGSGFNAEVDIIKLQNSILHEEWKAYAPDEMFEFPQHNVDRRVMGLIEKGGIQLQPKIINSRKGNYVVADMGGYPSNGPRFHDYIYAEIDRLEEWLTIVVKSLNKKLYASLEREYDYLTSDEAVADALICNEIPFTKDGRSAVALESLFKPNE